MEHDLKKFQKLINDGRVHKISGHISKSNYKALKSLGIPIQIIKENDCYVEVIIKKGAKS